MQKNTIQLEKQAKQAFQALKPQFRTAIRRYLERLKLGERLPGEVPLNIMPGCFALWLPETKHVILFQRIPQNSFFRKSLKIIVKLIDDKSEERLTREYFRSTNGNATPEEPTPFDPTSAVSQRWVFLVKFALTLAAVGVALLVEFGSKTALTNILFNPNEQSAVECSSPGQADVALEKTSADTAF